MGKRVGDKIAMLFYINIKLLVGFLAFKKARGQNSYITLYEI